MLAVGAGVGCLDIFLSPHIISLSFLSLSGRRLDIDVGRFRILGGGGGGEAVCKVISTSCAH